MQNPNTFYIEQKENAENKITELKKQLNLYAWCRGLWFVFSIFITYFTFTKSTKLTGLSVLVVVFLILVFFIKKYSKKNNILKHYQRIVKINEIELQVLDYNFDNLYSGNEFVQTNHDFSYDLDLFGESSVFQMISRANTKIGKQKVAKYLSKPLQNAQKINAIQKAVAEISGKGEWRQKFSAYAMHANEEAEKSNYNMFASSNKNKAKSTDFSKLKSLNKLKNVFGNTFWNITLIALPVAVVAVIVLAVMGIIPDSFILFISFFMLGVVGTKMKYINAVHNEVSKQAKIFARYSKLLEMIEKCDFESDLLCDMQQQLITKGKEASAILKEFAKLLNLLDGRLNILFAFLANATVLWDMQIVKRIEQWNKKYSTNFELWFDFIAEFEYLISLATFSFNNPSFVFPEISEKMAFDAKSLGHPMIPHKQRVTNDFAITDKTKTFIVTGANMAGKSTFLRTIGTNLILSQIGSVVCANQMKIKPMRILTSIRITDSLSSNESYFFAELKRLQYIVEIVEKGEEALVIIDEMLRGTNSHDKHAGSEGLLRKLTKLNVVSFLATHDVELGKLEQEFPNLLKNYCFEAEIKNDELFFDYRLRNGVSQNLNASFLMKKMKIIAT